MGLFDVDYNRLSWQNMPVRLRKSIHYAWLKCLVLPVVYLHGLFTTNRANNLYRLNHSSQVCYIEALLNDTFDNIDRGIFISEIEYHDPVYIYESLENKPVYIDLISEIGTSIILPPDPIPLYTDAEVSFTAPFFIVNVPSTIIFDITRMKALIDQYRLAGRTIYQIVTF
ncbi:MAG: hypothetical protein JWQ38_193 [Flavipsychrobacter sp.]|nr:hypothetical protein [Flavipsychrobacter sp.]